MSDLDDKDFGIRAPYAQRILELEDKLAMQDEALREVISYRDNTGKSYEEVCEFNIETAKYAISATSEDVAAWKEKQLAPLQREVAILYSELNSISVVVGEYLLFTAKSTDLSATYHQARLALVALKATAEAYEQKIRTEAKVEVADMIERELQLYAGQDIADRIRYDMAASPRNQTGETK